MRNTRLFDRQIIRLSPTEAGEDVRQFLQGLVTQDTAADMPSWAGLLSPQGKALFDFLLWAEADDVLTDDDGAIEVLTAPADFESVRNALMAAGFTPEVAGVTMRAENMVELGGDEALRMQKLLDIIEDLDDVQDVYHNAQLDGVSE